MTGSTGGGGYSGGGGYGGGYGGDSGMSQEEKDLAVAQKNLLELQTKIVSQQYDTMKALMPMMAKEQGYDLTFDKDGNITGYTPGPDAIKRGQLNSEILDQSLKAVRGELPISSTLTRALDEQELAMRNRLAQQFGPGYETSSPGIESIQKFNEGAASLKEDASRGLLTSSEQLSTARTGANLGSQGALSNTVLGQPMNIAQMFGTIGQGYAAAQVPFTQSRIAAQQSEAQIQAAQAGASAGSQGGGFASLLPFLMMGGLSDEATKTDIHDTGEDLPHSDIPIKSWRYKTDPPGTIRIGPTAQDVQDEVPAAVYRGSDGKLHIREKTLGEALGMSRKEQMAAERHASDMFMKTMTLGQVFQGAH